MSGRDGTDVAARLAEALEKPEFPLLLHGGDPYGRTAAVLAPVVDAMRREFAIDRLMAVSELLDEMGMGEAAVVCTLRAAALRGEAAADG